MSIASSIHASQGLSSNQQQPSLHENLSDLVSKRVATINYLHRAHQGSTHWFNTILLTRDDLATIYSNSKMQRRSCQFFTLGLSLGAILDVTNPDDYLKALTQLLHDFELYTSESSNKKMKNIFRKATKGKDDQYSTEGEYSHLLIPHVPFELDYIETFFTLCDIMAEAYQKLPIAEESQVNFELVLKCDGKLKKILSLVSKELDALARTVIKEELKRIDPFSAFSNKISPIEFEGTDI